jgi:hypothetical protein
VHHLGASQSASYHRGKVQSRIAVAFVLPSGEQISMAKARQIAQLSPAHHGESDESAPFNGTEPNGEPLAEEGKSLPGPDSESDASDEDA